MSVLASAASVEASPHAVLDALAPAAAHDALLRCGGSPRWAMAMLAQRPFGSASGLAAAARAAFSTLAREDWLEAFAHHPPIGGDLGALRARFASTRAWSTNEQSGVAGADEATLSELAAGNVTYRERFGYVFLICATGKSAREMLLALRERLANEPEQELAIAASEHERITTLRLAKLATAESVTTEPGR